METFEKSRYFEEEEAAQAPSITPKLPPESAEPTRLFTPGGSTPYVLLAEILPPHLTGKISRCLGLGGANCNPGEPLLGFNRRGIPAFALGIAEFDKRGRRHIFPVHHREDEHLVHALPGQMAIRQQHARHLLRLLRKGNLLPAA